MIDRLFTLALLACALLGGTVAIGSELLRPIAGQDTAQARIATLPRVVVTGRKQATTPSTAVAQSGDSDSSLAR